MNATVLHRADRFIQLPPCALTAVVRSITFSWCIAYALARVHCLARHFQTGKVTLAAVRTVFLLFRRLQNSLRITCTIGCIPVCPEDVEVRLTTHSDMLKEGHEVAGEIRRLS